MIFRLRIAFLTESPHNLTCLAWIKGGPLIHSPQSLSYIQQTNMKCIPIQLRLTVHLPFVARSDSHKKKITEWRNRVVLVRVSASVITQDKSYIIGLNCIEFTKKQQICVVCRLMFFTFFFVYKIAKNSVCALQLRYSVLTSHSKRAGVVIFQL